MIDTELASWSTWLRVAGRPDTTIRLRTYHVRRVLAALDVTPWDLTTQDLVDWLGAQPWAAETRRSYRSSLRQFYGWALATGRTRTDPAALMPSIRPPRAVPHPTPEDVYRAARASAPTRVRLMIELGARIGLRAGEIARTHRDDVVPDLVGHSLRVIGKGGHERLAPLPDDLAATLLRCPPGWIFPSDHPGRGRRGGHLTANYVGRLVSAELPPGWSCHSLRHRCATVAYHATRDLRAVQELLGHAKPETTARYTQIQPDSVRAAMRAAAA